MQETKVLIIIPAFNEAHSIRHVIREIRKYHPQYPILVINDGSSDHTAQEAEKAGAWVLSHPYNLGIGGAVQTGYKIAQEAGYDIAVQVDGDAQHDPAYLSKIIEPIASNRLDLCIGSRFLSKESPFKSSFFRRTGIRFFSLLLKGMTGVYLTDPTSGFRATGKMLIKRFSEYYPCDFPEPEAIKMAKRWKARIGEVPVKMHKRLGGTSSLTYVKSFYYMIKVTFAILIDALKREK